MNKYFTGVGSQKTPGTMQATMRSIGRSLVANGYMLRSGHADGADKAFEASVGLTQKEIYLPWVGFNGARIGSMGHIVLSDLPEPIQAHAYQIAEEYHPNWGACSDGAKKLLTRDVLEVLGSTLDNPSQFVVCWTPNGSGSGGTGQAIRIANGYSIPVFDLGSTTGFDKLIEYGQSL